MSSAADPAVEDPVGVMVSLVAAIEHGLDTEQIRDVVVDVAGGRAKSRRLAAALRARPALLCDGLSPAPRGLADLLIGLRQAGASSISPPRCANCDKELRTYQRRGEDWYCGVCGPRLEACSACANLRRVATRDRAGRPRCARCPEVYPRDPITVICAQVSALQPDADTDVIATVVRDIAPRPAHRQRLAQALEDNPDLLKGAGHLAPVPAVVRLIEALLASGVTGVVRPTCGCCHRVVRISKVLDGQRVCRSCIAKSRAEPCFGCGAVREPATRDEQGRPLCPTCLVTDPNNLETCVNCGRRRTVSTRSPHGPLCPTCPPLAVLVCSICREAAPCGISRITEAPWCIACQQRRVRCTGCNENGQVCSGTLDEPRCEGCTTPASRADCPTCQGRRRVGGCPPCRLEHRLGELLTGSNGTICAALQPLQASLASSESPASVLRWLTRPVVSTFLADVAAGRRQLTHEELDALPQSPTAAHLRAVLVATVTLPARDEHMARLEHLLDGLLAGRDPAQRQLLGRYALWHLLPRLRRRNNGSIATYEQLAAVRQQVCSAVALLDWMSDEHLDLATCRQGDLDRWLARPGVNHHHPGHFIRWATRQRACNLSFPATRWQGPTGALDDEARWEAARRLLRDDDLDTRDRVAGLLVLLYAQKTTAISRLTTDQIDSADGIVRLRLGTAPIALPDQLAALVVKLTASYHGHATTGADGSSPWLFPGGQPGRPISAERLRQRLKALGIQPRQARNTALFQLATELPAALLARLLGIDISAAIAWQRISSGDWMTYAADVSRRSQPHDRR